MAWETRGIRRYLYKSVRTDGKVIRRYLGKGVEAEDLAEQIEQARAARTARREADLADRLRVEETVAIAKQAWKITELVISASLLAYGYHTHKGDWRRRRHAK